MELPFALRVAIKSLAFGPLSELALEVCLKPWLVTGALHTLTTTGTKLQTKVYLLFVHEEDKYNCFNLRSHKGNWIFFFFFVIQSNSDMKAFQAVGLYLNSEY